MLFVLEYTLDKYLNVFLSIVFVYSNHLCLNQMHIQLLFIIRSLYIWGVVWLSVVSFYILAWSTKLLCTD